MLIPNNQAPGKQNAPLHFQSADLSQKNTPLNGNSGASDLSSISSEVGRPDGDLNPALLQMMYETKLQSDLQNLERSRGSGDREMTGQAMDSLGQTYSQAKQQQIPLSPELENAVKQALGIADGSDSNGNLDALGGGGADNGGLNGSDSGGGGADNGGLNGSNSGGGGADNGGLNGSNSGGGGADNGGLNGSNSNGSGAGGLNGSTSGGGGGSRFRDSRGGGSVNTDNSPPANLTTDDKRFLNDAISQDSKSFGDLVTAWKQGAEGNCSTVACIKAAMDRYDNKVFDQVTKTDNGYNIVMQDGYKMSLGDHELAAASKASRFKGPDGPAKSYANFLYGAAAKRNSLDNKMSLRASFNDLNRGESVHNPPKLLGLKHQVVKLNPRTLNGQDSVVAASRRHAVFIDRNPNGGHTTDKWGKRSRFNGTDGARRSLVTAFTFKPKRNSSTGKA